jgi:hypothetical protein
MQRNCLAISYSAAYGDVNLTHGVAGLLGSAAGHATGSRVDTHVRALAGFAVLILGGSPVPRYDYKFLYALPPGSRPGFLVARANIAQNFTVTAKDAYGNIATGYTGTIHFSSSDKYAELPANYTFIAANKGRQSFYATFHTLEIQSLTATDTVLATLTGTEGGITVEGIILN